MRKLRGVGKTEMAARHIAFREEDRDSYTGAMLHDIASERAEGRTERRIRCRFCRLAGSHNARVRKVRGDQAHDGIGGR